MKHLPIILSFTYTRNQSYYSPLFQPQGFDCVSKFYTESFSSKQSLTITVLEKQDAWKRKLNDGS